MGLKNPALRSIVAKISKRASVYRWRVRYWWLDTEQGKRAHLSLLLLAALVAIVVAWRVLVAAFTPAPGQPHQSVIAAIVIAIIALIIALAAVLMMPDTPAPPPGKDAAAPTTEDGQNVKHHFGTVWVDDTFMLAWKIVGKVPIKSSGGK